MPTRSIALMTLLLRTRTLAVWVLVGGLLAASTLAATACRNPPEHRDYAEREREQQAGDSVDGGVVQDYEQRIEEKTERLGDLEVRVEELSEELELTDRRRRTAEGRVDAQRESVATLEAERDDLHEQIEFLNEQVERLRRRSEERTFAPLVREELPTYEYYTGDRPELPEGYRRADEGGFGFDYPESWSVEVRPSLERTDFLLRAEDGSASLRIRMWPYPNWAGLGEIEEGLNDWLFEQVTEIDGARARLHPDKGRAVELIAGLPTIVGEYNFTNEQGVSMRHRRAAINLAEGDGRYRSFQLDVQYETTDQETIEQTLEVWENVAGSFWLATGTEQ